MAKIPMRDQHPHQFHCTLDVANGIVLETIQMQKLL